MRAPGAALGARAAAGPRAPPGPALLVCLGSLALAGASASGRSIQHPRTHGVHVLIDSSPHGNTDDFHASSDHSSAEHSSGHSGQQVRTDDSGVREAKSVSTCLLVFTVLIPIITYMAVQTEDDGTASTISDLTFKMLDAFITLFLAMLYFEVLTDVLALPAVRRAFPEFMRPYVEEVMAILHGVVIYVIVLLVAFKWRDNHLRLMTFVACSAHYIGFAGMAASAENQHKLGKVLAERDYRWVVSFLFCIICFVLLGVISFLTHWIINLKKASTRHMKAFAHAVDHLELDVVGLIVSYIMVQSVRHLLTGRYPPQAHMLLRTEDHFVHNEWQRWFMLGFSIALTMITACTLTALERFNESLSGDDTWYWRRKAIHVIRVVMVMCVAWGYLLWGEWQFYEKLSTGDGVFCRMIFAALCTFVMVFLLWGLSAIPQTKKYMKHTINLSVMGLSLVVAWSWERCFARAITILGKNYEVGYGGLVPKAVIAFIVPLAVLPVYVQLKEKVLQIDENFDKRDTFDENFHKHDRSMTA